MAEGSAISFTIAATSAPDSGSYALSAELLRPNGSKANPLRYSFADHGDGTGTFTWRVPERRKDSDYTVKVTADNGVQTPVVDSFDISVIDINAPRIEPLEDRIVAERDRISVDVVAHDFDGFDTIMLDAILYRPNGQLANPARYDFVDRGDGTGQFIWNTPTRASDGDYRLEILADDGDNHVVRSDMTITVLDIDDLAIA
ncbi:MAG: hypothetical protein OIF40_10270 [Mangrovicoccus sp.]|nr:hypothetical protein [Mangrovicoccus sp.]